jgi:hypothetical protein
MLNGGIAMRGRGNILIGAAWRRWAFAIMLPLALILAWPIMGAGQSGGGEREALRFAWQVEASATVVVGPRPVSRG